ncbi:MAG: glutamate racemase [Clostridiales bacterium]|nr:glutamate racemase [Clostridiales bacterium]
MRENPIGVFDSGVGGLNVLTKCERLLPNERFIYLADEANMPYGSKSAAQIKLAAEHCAETLFSMNCKAVVIACNTATVTAIDDIRALYGSRTVIGLEPAVKPCFRELGKSGYAVALVTSATYRSNKFERLIATCGGRVKPIARPDLAKFIEDNLSDIEKIAPLIHEIFTPYKTAEAVILGCSHYTYISKIISDFYGGKIKIYDGAEGAAQRLRYCLSLSDMLAPATRPGGVRFYSTFKRID